MEELKDKSVKDFQYIGKRLKAIREDLKEKDEIQNKRKSEFSLKKVAEKLGIKSMTLTNIERGSFSISTIKLLLYYYSLGYNPMWVLVYENEFLTMQNFGENLIYQKDVQERFSEMQSSIIEAMNQFKSNI